MDKQEILELMARFEAGSLARMKLTVGEVSLELEKAVVCSAPTAPAVQQTLPTGGEEVTAGPCITAPLVGTFYAAAEPGAQPFVKPGDHVSKGQTVGLLEAMKMMSEVQAPCDCVIEEILVENGSLAGYDAPLFRVRRV